MTLESSEFVKKLDGNWTKGSFSQNLQSNRAKKCSSSNEQTMQGDKRSPYYPISCLG